MSSLNRTFYRLDGTSFTVQQPQVVFDPNHEYLGIASNTMYSYMASYSLDPTSHTLPQTLAIYDHNHHYLGYTRDTRYCINRYKMLVTLPVPLSAATMVIMPVFAYPAPVYDPHYREPLEPRPNRSIPIVKPSSRAPKTSSPHKATPSVPDLASSGDSICSGSTSFTSLSTVADCGSPTPSASASKDLAAIWDEAGSDASNPEPHPGLFCNGTTGWYHLSQPEGKDAEPFNGLITDPLHTLRYLGL